MYQYRSLGPQPRLMFDKINKLTYDNANDNSNDNNNNNNNSNNNNNIDNDSVDSRPRLMFDMLRL